MKSKCMILMAVLTLAAAFGCRRHDWRTITIHVPEMRGEPCARIVMQALSGLPGLKVDKVVFDIEGRTVTLTYDSLLAADKNAEFRVADAGFRVLARSRGTAFEIPANTAAQSRLPPDCRP